MKQLSIVIVTYNSENDIFDCLESIYKYNDIGEELEVIVVDNNSENASKMFVEIGRMYPTVILVKNEKNGGYGQGNNIGIKLSKAPFVMIMNPDVRLYEFVFSYFIRIYYNNSNTVLVGFQQRLSLEKKGVSFLSLDNSVFDLVYSKVAVAFDYFNSRKMCIAGACFTIRKQSFEKIGLFDEKIFLYGEEIDIHTRLSVNKENRIEYLSNIGYIHLITKREQSIQSEKKQLDSFLFLCDKYEWDKVRKLKERLLVYRILRFKNKILKRDISVLNETISLIGGCINLINE